MNGILNILKPPGMTSHDVVAFVRKKTRIKRVGHTGTLDPNAAGVLPICIGTATKISQYLLDSEKKYRAELTLGIETDTQDIYGTVLKTNTVDIEYQKIEEKINEFIGVQDQIPPMYSALKIQGKKLYQLAREGKEIHRDARMIKIHSIDIIKISVPRLILDVECSKGTYIRTLCKDIGDALGCGGVMSFLLRTKTNVFDLSTAITLEKLDATSNVQDLLFPTDYPLENIPKVNVSNNYKKMALNGNTIGLEHTDFCELSHETDHIRVYVDDLFIGIGKIERYESSIYPEKNRSFIKFLKVLV